MPINKNVYYAPIDETIASKPRRQKINNMSSRRKDSFKKITFNNFILSNRIFIKAKNLKCVGEYMQKIIFISIILLAILIAGCSQTIDESVYEQRSLSIYNWEDYFAPDTISNFEEEFNISVTLDIYEDEEEISSALQSNPTKYDLIFPTEDVAKQLLELNLIQHISVEHIPNIKNLDHELDEYLLDPEHEFSVPYTVGTTGILYNSKVVSPQDVVEKSWSLLWNDAYSVGIVDNSEVSVGLTLKYLGYSINSNDEEELAAAQEKILEGKPFWIVEDIIFLRDEMIDETIDVSMMYSGDAVYAMEENPDLKFYVPKEGSDIYFDVMTISIGVQNKDEAEEFINYILRPDVHTAIMEYTGYSIPNAKAVELGLVSEETAENEAQLVLKNKEIELEQWNPFANSSASTINAKSIWSLLQQ